MADTSSRCPCCYKLFRCRTQSVSAASCAVRHIAQKAKGGCHLHKRMDNVLKAHGSWRALCCPADGCELTYERERISDLFEHIASTDDASHAACRQPATEVYALHEPIDVSMKRATLQLAAGPDCEAPDAALEPRMLTLLQRPGTEVSSISDIGTRLWDSSVALTRLMKCHCIPDGSGPLSASRVQASRVCELGAGCGLVGMTFALHGAAHVVLTDLEAVVPHLQENVAANFEQHGETWVVRSSLNGGGPDCRVECRAYTWGTDPHAAGLVTAGGNANFDFLVAADAIYLSEQIEPFLASLRALATEQTVILLALEKRSPDVWQAFNDGLRESFRVRSVNKAAVQAAVGEGANVERLSILLCQRKGTDSNAVDVLADSASYLEDPLAP